ncbi:MAG: hypothetical protein DMF61_25160 [Blastocatellia bacterium AA13]|nr:MAG: hypothetical protein DMF61_25160 [Blastocatellia bacterium AA13]
MSVDRVVPMLTKQQIAEMRDFAEKMPYSSTISKEFTDAASLAERWYEQRAATQEQETDAYLRPLKSAWRGYPFPADQER